MKQIGIYFLSLSLSLTLYLCSSLSSLMGQDRLPGLDENDQGVSFRRIIGESLHAGFDAGSAIASVGAPVAGLVAGGLYGYRCGLLNSTTARVLVGFGMACVQP